jgi:pSer/pThr/pTyr-binding forkhead associated (FHA) protein
VGAILSSLRGGGAGPCVKCGRQMMPEWTQCLFCGHNPNLSSGKPAMLHFVTGPLKDQVVVLEKSVTTIGSVPGNDVILADTGVSRKHVGIRKVDGEYELADFGSTNGVFVNGEKLPRKRLAVGDIIRVGTTEIVFRT